MKKKTLEQYLLASLADGAIDHALRARIDHKGDIVFYIHPAGADGDTLDFKVSDGNVLTQI